MERADRTYTKDEVMSVMEPLVSAWFNERFDTLTEPQAKAIPIIHERKNVLVSSPTGSGKTLTAFLSIINELTRYASEGKLEERTYCIYISPLKALANDINRNLNTPLDEMKKVAREKGMMVPDIRVAVRSGDTSQYERQKMLKRPPHILITTPESLALVLEAPKFKERLKNVEWVILDEIHDICDSKRGAFLSLTLERLRAHCGNPITRIGLSATLAPIEAIAGFLAGVDNGKMRDVTLVESGTRKKLDLKVICPTEDMTALSSEIVNAKMYDQLKELIEEHETTLVFTNTRSGAESVVYKLKERGMENIEVHHSSLGKETRLNVEERLKRGEIKCVVSSTSLELGIDIGSVDLVCQIGSPKSVAKGLQRIGRSGHSMGRTSKGRLLVFDQDDLVECAVMCRAAHRGDIDRVGIPENCLDVLAQATVGMSLDSRWDVDDAYDMIKGSYCYRDLPKEKFISVLKYLGSKDEFEGVYSKIWYDPEDNKFGRKKGARMIYFMNLGTIPEEANYRVLTGHGSSMGELSEKFVERLSPRDIFVLGGRSFEFVRTKGMSAYVKEASGRKPTVPSWAGEMLPRSFDLSMEVARFRGELSERMANDNAFPEDICDEFDIDEGSARSILSYFKEQKATTDIIPDHKRLAIEEYVDPSGNHRLIFHFPFGRRVNDALSRGYAYRLSNMLGCNVSVSMSDDSFMIGTPRPVDIEKVGSMLSSKDLEGILRKAVKDSEIFKMRFRHTASRSFMILRNYMGRSISVNRQQTRSAYLLDALGSMDDMPVIEETYREVLEDDMDIKNARVVLDMIERGEMKIETIRFSGTPSPFAHNAILSGYSDIVLMEDRSALLRELHRKVLYRAMGDSIKDFEFEEDRVIPYFREKIGRIACKDDIVPMLMRTGPLQAFRERGRNVYAYADADRKTVDQWCRELLKEGKIGTVFLDDPHIMAADEIKWYASAVRKEREINEIDAKVLGALSTGMTTDDIVTATAADEDTVFRSLRKLESMYEVTRTDIQRNKWSFSRSKYEEVDRNKALDRIIMRYLECFAPATVHEAAFSLSLPEKDVRTSLDALTADEEVACGRFLISENDQYMKRTDRMRLKTGHSNVFSRADAERYRRSKGSKFGSIEEYFKFYGSAGSVLDVFNRVTDFDLKEWGTMRSNGRILLGRFVRGRVRYVLSEDGERYASIRSEPLMPIDGKVLAFISGMGRATTRELIAETDIDKDEIKESVNRLDRALKIVRAYDEREDWGSENVYEVYRPGTPAGNIVTELAEQAVRAYGPVPAVGIRFIVGVPQDEVPSLMNAVGATLAYIGEGQTPMYIMPDEIPKIGTAADTEVKMQILSLFDPALASKWSEISSRYGDRWIYPVVLGDRIYGALEIWEMSGCVEIRQMDIEQPERFGELLDAADDLMRFFIMKGQNIVRIREALNTDAAELPESMVSMLTARGYHFVNGFYAKGRFVPVTFTDDELTMYAIRKQRALPSVRYRTAAEAIADRGYIRTDAEMLTRVAERTPLKKLAERGGLMQMSLLPGFHGYTTQEFARLYRDAKNASVDDEMKILKELILDRQPVTRKELLHHSPFSSERTLDVLGRLTHASLVYTDGNRGHCLVQGPVTEQRTALKDIIRRHFKCFGAFSAEQLYRFVMSSRMAELRSILAELEAEGSLVKGFLRKDDPTVMWILAEDIDKKIEMTDETFLLNTQDNLHVYLRNMVKEECGASENAVFRGTKIIGSFKGKLTVTGAKVDDLKGSDDAVRYVKELMTALGVSSSDRAKEEDRDWDVCEFYHKTHPGSRTKK
ncbi:MAG: ATP-dependent helicase [Methanomassiliicoccaceae archaeon]|jgi:ATP-dependent Lhr-like helicase|nr:ATP-dependent helicase [Methanomassiliicoccaceae archaeon]